MAEALELPCDLFLACYRAHVIERLSQTEEGLKYLEDCERLKQTKPDREGLRKLMEGLGNRE